MEVCIGAALAILILQTLGHQFVRYDDPGCVFMRTLKFLGAESERCCIGGYPHARLPALGLKPSGHHAINVPLQCHQGRCVFWVLWTIREACGRAHLPPYTRSIRCG